MKKRIYPGHVPCTIFQVQENLVFLIKTPKITIFPLLHYRNRENLQLYHFNLKIGLPNLLSSGQQQRRIVKKRREEHTDLMITRTLA